MNTIETNVPNLDCMSSDELMEFWMRHQNGRNSKQLFPKIGSGSIRSTRSLANYAANKSTAMQCRINGDIAGAQMYESFCERIYLSLPTSARW
jgi:hypothetical protein